MAARPSSPPVPESKPAGQARASMQVYLRCIHCRRNQSRHLRTGRGNWTCRYCKELNPGPALTDRVLAVRRAKSGQPAAAAPEPNGTAEPPSVGARVTRRSSPAPSSSTRSSTPRAAERNVVAPGPPAAAASATGQEPAGKSSMWGRIVLGET